MPKTPSAPPLTDIFTKVWHTCLTLWPLFFVQLVFAILQYVTLFLCLGLMFGPFIRKNIGVLLEGMKNPDSFDWKPLADEASVYFTDPAWIVLGVGLLLLYVTWWCLLTAVSDGGVYRAFWGHFQSRKDFSLKDFFQDGFRWLVPMIGLQILLALLLLLVLVLWGCVGLLAWGAVLLLGSSTGVIVLVSVIVGIPFLSFWLAFGLVFPAYCFLCKGLLTKGMGPWASVQAAFGKFAERGWRAGIGLIVAFLTYVMVSMVTRGTLAVLGMIPLIGLLFQVLDFFIGMALMIFVMLYLPALSVAFLSEKDA